MKKVYLTLVSGFLLFVSCYKWDLEQKEFVLLNNGGITVDPFTCNRAEVDGVISIPEGQSILAYGHAWATHSFPSFEDHEDTTRFTGNFNSFFTSKIEDLIPLTTYYVVAYAQTSEGVIYSPVDSFEVGWTKKRNDKIRHNGTAFTIGNTAYVGLGFISDDQGPDNRFYLYRPVVDDWQTVAELFPGGTRGDIVSFTLNEKGYVGTGVNRLDSSVKYNDFFEFNPQSGTWTKIASLPNPGRSGAFAFVVNDTAYILGGYADSGLLDEVYKYNSENDSWEYYSRLPSSNSPMAVFTVKDRAFLLLNNNNVYEFNPGNSEQAWISRAEIKFPGQPQRTYPSFWSFQDKAYFGFGQTDSQGTRARDLWKFDPDSTEPWTRVNDLPANGLTRSGSINFTVQNKGFLLGGFHGNTTPLEELWEFCTN